LPGTNKKERAQASDGECVMDEVRRTGASGFEQIDEFLRLRLVDAARLTGQWHSD
jgi:hypothetical protein